MVQEAESEEWEYPVAEGGTRPQPRSDDRAEAAVNALEVSLLAAVNRDLHSIDSEHPAAESLAEAARLLAATADLRSTRVDARQVAVVVKELRATLADLTRQEAVDDDDDLGVSAPVVISAPA